MTWWPIILSGFKALQDYIALHVLTCLVPAFLLAGALVTFVSREAIVRYMGAATSKLKSFALAAGGSFFVAACSCTVIPVASGLYYSGAGVGPAFILLWVAPAANVLALVYTGALLGARMVIVRLIAALLMAFAVGGIMSLAFGSEERARAKPSLKAPAPNQQSPRLMGKTDLILVSLLVIALLGPNYIVPRGPYWQKLGVWAAGMVLVFGYAFWTKTRKEILRWLRETWWFVRLVFPLLLVGVFGVGILGALLPEAWVTEWLGGTSLRSSFLATLIGAVSYFATMSEAPFVHKLKGLGMGAGPALALLLTGPGLSLPNWLAIARVFGLKKALVYVPTLIVLGTLLGWVAGNTVLR
ncbi:MAG: permease [Candidatus Bipolaricaulota bacterium]|nr:permease [Candidatus Bipolaricaulota bacterium]MDW8152570.1 permease [Candidatus Bipolaricaulota bacterium]